WPDGAHRRRQAHPGGAARQGSCYRQGGGQGARQGESELIRRGSADRRAFLSGPLTPSRGTPQRADAGRWHQPYPAARRLSRMPTLVGLDSALPSASSRRCTASPCIASSPGGSSSVIPVSSLSSAVRDSSSTVAPLTE